MMKLLVLLFFVGFAAASIYDPLDDAAEDFLQKADDDTRKEIVENLRRTLDEILEKMKDSLEKGKMYREDLQAKLEEIRQKMKDMKVDMGERAKELLEKVRDRVRNFVRDLLEKLKGKEKRSFEEQRVEFNLREMFKKLKDSLLAKIDKEKLKSRIEEIFGKGSEMADSLLDLINKKGDKYKQKLLELVENFLGKDESKRADDDTRKEIVDNLRRTLDEILEKMKDSLEKGKMFKEDLQAKLEDMRQKMKDMKIDMGERAKELLEKVRDRVRNFVRDLLEKLKGKEKRSFEEQRVEFNLREMFKKLKESLLQKIDKEKLKTRIEEIFGKGSEMADSILELMNKKGDKYKQKLLDLVDNFLGKDDSKRSISDMWEKVKDYFKDLHIDIKEKYMKFGEWVKETLNKGLEKGKSKVENIRNIAKEFIDHTKGVSKEVAVEALEFLKPYKEDLGSLWEQVKETVKDIVQRKD